MLLPIFEDRRRGASEEIIKTISTRIGGGRRDVDTQPPQVRVVADASEMKRRFTSPLGDSSHARVQIYLALDAACFECAGHSCTSHRRGLYSHARDVC